MKNLLLLLCFAMASPGYGAIDPVYKECMQRAYQVDGEYCVFPDSSRCLLEDFNGGRCGTQWMTDDYCVSAGNYIWDAERCCEELVAYLPEGVAGQATCQPKPKVLYDGLLSGGVSYVLLAVGLLLVLLLLGRKKRKKRKY